MDGARGGPRLIEALGLRVRMDCGEAALPSESKRVLKRLLVEGVRALPHRGGEEVLSRVGAVLSCEWTDTSRGSLDPTWDSAAALDLPCVRVAGLPLVVEIEELVEPGEGGAAIKATLGVAGVVDPDAERFLPARRVGGGMVAPGALVSRVM